MSLFSKIFKKRKGSVKHGPTQSLDDDILKEWSEQETLGPTIPFDDAQIRIIVFRESEQKGRQVLFDSDHARAIHRSGGGGELSRKNSGSSQPSPYANKSSSSETWQSKTLDQQRQDVAHNIRNRADIRLYGEMVFGSIPMAVRSVVTKIHEMRSPPQVMLTKLYPVYVPTKKTGEDDESVNGTRLSESRSSWSSEDSLFLNSPPGVGFSIPDKLFRRSDSRKSALSPSLTPSHSSSSLSSLPFSPPKFPSSSMMRRFIRNRSTSLDNGMKGLLDAESSDEAPEGHTRRRTVYAISCIIKFHDKDATFNQSFQEFFFTHTPMFEYSIGILKANLEIALCNRLKFSDVIYSAYEAFVAQVGSFIRAPRLPNPMWLRIGMEKIADQSYIPVLRLRLVATLAELTRRFDCKESQFFMSKLVTAVLIGHLGWVSTVTPSEFQAEVYKQKYEADWTELLARTHPYNALWAQLGDLLGMCSSPPRFTKTILVSKDPILLQAFLHVLSYLIRTSDVGFNRFEPYQPPRNGFTEREGHRSFEQYSRCSRNPSADPQRASGTSGMLQKTKRMSGSRSRLASYDDDVLNRDLPRNMSFNTIETGDMTPEMRPRRMTADSMYRLNTNRTIGNPSASASQTSIAEESPIFMEGDTDDKKLHKFCTVAHQVLSDEKERQMSRKFTFTQHSTENGERVIERKQSAKQLPFLPKKVDVMTNSEKPVTLLLQEQLVSRFRPVPGGPKFSDPAFDSCATFSTSLLSAPIDRYVPHFALQGCAELDMEKLGQDLMVAAEISVTDEESKEASAIIADLDSMNVQVITCCARKASKGVTVPSAGANGDGMCRRQEVQAANYIVQALETVTHLWGLRTTPEFCLMHLEDRLQEVYIASRAMVSFIRNQNTIDTKEMMELLGMDLSDYPLLLAVVSTHSGDVLSELNPG